jgi:hypothetical protein
LLRFFCVQRAYDIFTCLSLYFFARVTGYLPALTGNFSVLRFGDRRFFFLNFRCSSLGKHVEHQLKVGHVIAQALGF